MFGHTKAKRNSHVWLQCASRTVLGLVIGMVLLLTVKPFRSAGLEILQAHSSNASRQQLQVCNHMVADVITTVGVSGRKRQVSRFIQVEIIYSRGSYPLYRLRFIQGELRIIHWKYPSYNTWHCGTPS